MIFTNCQEFDQLRNIFRRTFDELLQVFEEYLTANYVIFLYEVPFILEQIIIIRQKWRFSVIFLSKCKKQISHNPRLLKRVV